MVCAKSFAAATPLQIHELQKVLVASIAHSDCHQSQPIQWENRYHVLIQELRLAMRANQSLHPVDASRSIHPILRFGADYLTDNAEVASDVPAILASESAINAKDNLTLAYLIAVKHWPLGEFVHFDSSIEDAIPQLPRKPRQTPKINHVDDAQFKNKTLALLPAAEIAEKALYEYVQRQGTGGGLIATEIYAYLEPRSLRLASPLVNWLLDQAKNSLTLSDCFAGAMKIYNDPRLAVTMIAYVLWLDNAAIPYRKISGVMTSKLQPLFGEKHDVNGSMYHFWSYLRRAMSGDSVFRLRLISFGHEIIGQNDDFEYGGPHCLDKI